MERNTKLIFAAFATLMAAACTKQTQEGVIDSPVSKAKEPMSITCESNGTKTQLAKGGKVNWSEGDQLKIFTTGTTYEGVESEKFDLNIVEGNLTQATFEGEVAEGTTAFVALYPYSENASFDGSILTTEIPTKQSATPGNFAEGAALAWAKGTKTIGNPTVSGVQMQNICALMAFTLPENITFAKTVTITANAENAHVAGAVQVNVGTGEISYVGGNSVELSGDFVGGNVYYTTIAPGTYEGGFTFVITTAEGNTYTRQNTSPVVAEGGKIAKLGTLSLALSDSDINCNVVISHNVESGILTGSTATASVSVATEEFQSLVTINSVDITLKQGETVFRTFSAEGAVIQCGPDKSEGKPYLPKGDYSYETVVNYTVGTIARSVTVSGTATSPQVSGLNFEANYDTVHTSYDTFVNSGADDANKEDGSTIFGSVKLNSGINSAVLHQCTDLLSIKTTVNGSDITLPATNQELRESTICAEFNFDGCTGKAKNEKIVQVTGIPFLKACPTKTTWPNFDKIEDWSYATTSGKGVLYGTKGYIEKQFYCPKDLQVSVSHEGKGRKGALASATTFSMTIGGVTKYSETITDTSANGKTVNFTVEGELSQSNNSIRFDNSYKNAASTYALTFYVTVNYN